MPRAPHYCAIAISRLVEDRIAGQIKPGPDVVSAIAPRIFAPSLIPASLLRSEAEPLDAELRRSQLGKAS
jgi:hypothetical protein